MHFPKTIELSGLISNFSDWHFSTPFINACRADYHNYYGISILSTVNISKLYVSLIPLITFCIFWQLWCFLWSLLCSLVNNKAKSVLYSCLFTYGSLCESFIHCKKKQLMGSKWTTFPENINQYMIIWLSWCNGKLGQQIG